LERFVERTAVGTRPESNTPVSVEEFVRRADENPSGMAAAVRGGMRVPVSNRRRLTLLLVLARPATSVAVLLAYVLGYSYTGQGYGWRAAAGLGISFLISAGGDLYNACSDLEEDIRNQPRRVYLVAEAGYRLVLASAILVSIPIALGGVLFIPYFLVLMLVAVVGLHQYSFPPLRAKAKPIIGLLAFAQAGIFPFVMGWMSQPSWRRPPTECVAMFAFFVVFRVARAGVKNLPDFFGDSAAGLRTSASVFSSLPRAVAAAMALTMAAFAVLSVTIILGLTPFRLILVVPLVVPLVWHLQRFSFVSDAAAGNALHLMGLELWAAVLGAVILVAHPGWTSVMACAAAGMLMALSLRLRVDPRVLGAQPSGGSNENV